MLHGCFSAILTAFVNVLPSILPKRHVMIFKELYSQKMQEAEQKFKTLFAVALKPQQHPGDLSLVLVDAYWDDARDSDDSLQPAVFGPGSKAQAATLAAEGVFVSPISFCELAIKLKIGKDIGSKRPMDEIIAETLASGFQWLPFTRQPVIAYQTIPLVDQNRNPFDRLFPADDSGGCFR